MAPFAKNEKAPSRRTRLSSVTSERYRFSNWGYVLVPDADVVMSACPFAPLMAGVCVLENAYAASVTA